MLKSLFPWKHHKTKVMAAQQTMDDEVPDINLQSQELLPCHVCGRTFLPAPLKKHERICEKTSIKKRKPFDSLKQRVEGTDLADFHQKSYLKKPEIAPAPDIKKKNQSSWKEKHLALVSAIRAAKGSVPPEVSNALPKTKSTTALMAGTERCPSCDRQFGPKAYDRHVEWCKEKKAQQRIHHSPANVLLAKERLEARTKYVPPLNRSKKTVIREKYSNHTSTETLVSVKGASPLSRGPSVRKPRSVIDMGKTNEKAGNTDDRKDRSKFDKSVSGGGDKAKMQENCAERCVPIIGSPSKSEVTRNIQKKRTTIPFTKLNNVNINSQIDGLTVASLKYDMTSKKMVTWRDTIKKSTINEMGPFDEKQEAFSTETSCKSTQSIKLRQESKKVDCDKILSSNDILHKDQPVKIPLSKYSFKNKLNLPGDSCKQMTSSRKMENVESSTTLTIKSSDTDIDDSSTDIDKRSSCNSVANAFEKLTIDSDHELKKDEECILEETYTPFESEDISLGQKTPTDVISIDDLESDSLTDIPSVDKNYVYLDETVLATRSALNCLQNNRKPISDWFDGYVKKAESVDCIDNIDHEENDEEICNDIEVENYVKECADASNSFEIEESKEQLSDNNGKLEKPNENVVFLFKSTTHLDLCKRISDFTIPDKKSETQLKKGVSQETCATNCERDSIDLDYRKASYFSLLKKSTSDICLNSTQSNMGLSTKNTLISIYWNKDKEISDEDSFVDSRKLFSSLPNISLKGLSFKDNKTEEINEVDVVTDTKTKIINHKEFLRRKILEIAAKEFVEDYHKFQPEDNLSPDETSCDETLLNFLEEEYTVPKKRRKVDSDCMKRKKEKVFKFSAAKNFDLGQFKLLMISSDNNILEYPINKSNIENVNEKNKQDNNSSDVSNLNSFRSDSTLCEVSSTMSTLNDYSPRIFAILDNVLNNDRHRVDDKRLVVMTSSDCRRLINLDKNKLPELKSRLKKIKREHTYKNSSSFKLPAIENGERIVSEDKEIQVDEVTHLPRIVNKKLRRRDSMKKLEVDIRKDVRNVYFEYDSERGNFNYNPFESAQRQFMELLECDDFKNLAPTCTPIKQTPRPHTSNITPAKQPSPTSNKKIVKSAGPKLTSAVKNINRASVIEPPGNFKDSLDSVTDDFELMENLINDHFTDDNKNNTNSFYLHFKADKESLTLSDILDNRKYSDDMSSIDPMLINENDNLSIPEDFRIDDYSPTSTIDTDITIQNDVDHYSVQYDNKIAAFEPKPDKIREKSPAKPKVERKPIVKRSVSLVNRGKTADTQLKVANKKLTSKSKITSKSVSSVASTKGGNVDKKKGLSTLKRSMTLFDPSPKPPSLKNKNDVNNYFSEQEQKMSASLERTSPVKELNNVLDDTLKPEDLFNVDDEMYEEYKKYEEMYLKEKAQKSATKKHKPKVIDISLGVHTASEEEDHSSPFNNKISNDSAYGSLTRKTPKHRSRASKLTPLEQKQVDSTSSSGSENCPNSPAAINQRFSKFCHECGNKYPLTTAKFCVECGVKRLVL